MLNKLIYSLFFIIITSISYAESVTSISVDGNKRISKETIIILSEVKIGDVYTKKLLNNSLKNLYETNFFKDVTLNFDTGSLKIIVSENPIIQTVIINGIKKTSLTDALYKELKLKNRSSFVEYIAKTDLIKITNILKVNGYYLTKIKTSISKNDNNTIDLIYDISLGEKAVINNIKFTGDKVFKNRVLKDIIVSEKSYFWKFISQNKYVDANRITLDVKLLTNFFKNKGYYNVKIENTSAQYLDKNKFDLIFNISAGPKFYFNEIKLTLPEDYDKNNFDDLLTETAKLKDKAYSFKAIEKILKEVDKVTKSKQYEFINAKINETIVGNNKLNFDIIVDNSESVYVKRVNITGNDITKEEVIRDQLIIDEGDAFNEILFNRSINNIKGLNFFKKVTVDTENIKSENSKVVNIKVEEKATGEISLGAGFGTSGGTVGFSIKENNYMGKGIGLTSTLSINEQQIRGAFSLNNPNFANSGKNLFTSIESTEINKMKNFGYKSSKTGVTVGTRYEQYENIFFSPSVSTYFEDLNTSTDASANLKKQEGNFFETNLSYAIDYDLRNSYYQPTEGYRSKFSQTIPIMTTTSTLINGYDFQSHHEFIKDMIGSLYFYGRAANAIADDKDVKVSSRLFMPEKKLRGFEAGKVGPMDGGDFIGGNYLTSVTLSTTIPQILQSFENTDLTIFLDAANIWGVDYDDNVHDSSKVRSSIGASIDFFSPLGPLSFSLSQAITKKATDITETFRFNLGTTF